MKLSFLKNAAKGVGDFWIQAQGGQVIEPLEGNVSHTTRALVHAARLTGKPASAVFNDIRITAGPQDIPSDVLERYMDDAAGVTSLQRGIAEIIVSGADSALKRRR